MLSFIRTNLPAREYQTWFAPAHFLDSEAGVVRLQVPNDTFANHLEGEYRDWILRAFEAAGTPKTTVRCEVLSASSPSPGLPGPSQGARIAVAVAPELSIRSEPLKVSFSFDTFVMGASNHYAYSAARDVSDPGIEYSAYNPLLIYGGGARGKTHLLQSVARRLLDENPECRILYTNGRAFSSHVVNAIKAGDLYDFREACTTLDALLVDDIQFLPGLDRFGRSTEEFFHTLNALSERGRQIVLTANAHPQDIQNLDGRIKSRLECGLTTEIEQPGWELRVGIVRQKAAALGADIPSGIAETLASHYKNNVPKLEGALKLLVTTARYGGVGISADLLDQVLSSLPSRRTRRPSIHEVMIAVATTFGLPPLRLTGPRRQQELVLARHVAMYLCRELTDSTLKEIGREFRRDHSSVTHAIRKIARRRKSDLGLGRIIERLQRELS